MSCNASTRWSLFFLGGDSLAMSLMHSKTQENMCGNNGLVNDEGKQELVNQPIS